MLSVKHLARQLADLGIIPGDTLMVHVSLRKLGRVDGGAEGVLQALMIALSPGGTLLMPLGALPGVPFDAETTPADPDIGVLAEMFRRHPGVAVSDHPAARWAAWGLHSDALLNPAQLHDYHGPGGTLERFVQRRGMILRLGADQDTTTLAHLAEYLANVPDKVRVSRCYEWVGHGETWVESLDDDDGFVTEDRDPTDDYFPQLLVDYLDQGGVRRSTVGQLVGELFLADEFLAFATGWLERTFGSTPHR